MQIVNYAAWIPAEKTPLEVATAPFPDLGANEVIIKNRAVAVNPVDWKIQASGGFGLSYPTILGEDVAGEIIEVGENVKGLRKGDRVIAHALGLVNGSEYGGFQLYPRLKMETVATIPDQLDFKQVVVLPLSISTAAAGLYLKATLGLKYPQLKSSQTSMQALDCRPGLAIAKEKQKTKPTLLLWGGSSSVGSSVIQLAVASGYDVVATASPANYSYVKSLGASLVLDYHNPDIVPILVSLLKENGTAVVGAYDAIGSDTTVRQSAAVIHGVGGGTVASVVAAPDDLPKDVKVARIGSTNIVSQESGIVARKIWREYVATALEIGLLKPAPPELIVGNGLNFVQGGLDRQQSGVSARKVVITL